MLYSWNLHLDKATTKHIIHSQHPTKHLKSWCGIWYGNILYQVKHDFEVLIQEVFNFCIQVLKSETQKSVVAMP